MRATYYGWYVVVLAMLVYMLMVGSTFSAFGLFVLPVSAELKLSRADMNTALILLNLGNAVLAPLVGRLLDRVPIKRVMIAGALLMGSSLVILGLSPSIWLSLLVLGILLPAGYLSAGTLTLSVLLARWFVVRRGRAMALATIGMSLGSMAVTPIVGLLIESQGWRNTLMILGGVIGVFMLTIALILRDRRPEDVEIAPQTPAAAQAAVAPPEPAAPLPIPALLRSSAFWLISLSAAMSLGVAQALAISLVPLGLDGGLTMAQAASLISVMGGAAMVGTLLLAVIADKVDRILLLTGLFVLIGLTNLVLLSAGGFGMLLASAAGLGLATGAATPAFYALLADRFGAASFGTVRGLTMPVVAGLGIAAVRFAGEVFDRTGDYQVMFGAFLSVQVVASMLMLAARLGAGPMARPAAAAAPVI